MVEHPKNKFQVERIAFFSDAVYAIAITLMVLEIKPPHIVLSHGTEQLIKQLAVLTAHIGGVVLSFVLIGMFWRRHHQLFKYITAYNEKFITLNLFMLCSVVFIPFSMSFVFENTKESGFIPLIFYNINFIISSLLKYRLFRYSLDPKNQLSETFPENERKYLFRELLFPNFIYIVVIVLCFFTPLAPIAYSGFALERFYVRRKS